MTFLILIFISCKSSEPKEENKTLTDNAMVDKPRPDNFV